MNMSCAPHTTFQYRGSDACRRFVVTLDVFAREDEDYSPSRWCQRLDLDPPRGTTPEAILAAHLDGVAAQLALPELVPVVIAPKLERCDPSFPLASRLAIVAKSSDRVYLARRTPILSSLVPGRTLVLMLPEDWRRMP